MPYTQTRAEHEQKALSLTGPRVRAAMVLACLAVAALALLAPRDMAGMLVALGALLIGAALLRRLLRAERLAEDLLAKLGEERSYHSFIDHAIEGFFRTTRDGHYLIVNPALARIYGYESTEQLTRELSADGLYVEPGRRDQFETIMAECRVVTDFVSQIRRRDGSVIWIAENARAVLDEDGQFLFYEGTVSDITVQRQSVEATRRALREFQEAARAKASFLAAMSHELKTPLNAVIGFSDLMLQEMFGPVTEPRYRSYIADIHENGCHLLTMINNILDLTRVEGGLADIEEEIVDLFDVLRSAADAALQGRAGPSLDWDVPALPLVKGDPRRLKQIFGHVLSNGVKFTPAAGGIHVTAAVGDTGIEIAIRDTGIGMEPERIAHALEPFKQLDARLARRFEGVGLGLPLANAFLRLHGGQLAISSQPGAGTTVRILLPPERIIRSDLARIA